MELIGKVIKQELKDFGKGKDAEANEVLVITAKLTGENGKRGVLHFEPPDDSQTYDLGDTINVTVEQRQTKLPLGKGRPRSAAAESH